VRCWCGACGGKAEGGRWPEMASRMEAIAKEPAARWTEVPEAPHSGRVGWAPGTTAAMSKESQNGGGGVKEVPAWQRRRGPDGGSV
jgi:hypothetical protein